MVFCYFCMLFDFGAFGTWTVNFRPYILGLHGQEETGDANREMVETEANPREREI